MPRVQEAPPDLRRAIQGGLSRRQLHVRQTSSAPSSTLRIRRARPPPSPTSMYSRAAPARCRHHLLAERPPEHESDRTGTRSQVAGLASIVSFVCRRAGSFAPIRLRGSTSRSNSSSLSAAPSRNHALNWSSACAAASRPRTFCSAWRSMSSRRPPTRALRASPAASRRAAVSGRPHRAANKARIGA